VPGRIRYDNLKPAVVRVLKGRDRQESERFTALRSTYGFDSFFCIPGQRGAHEKGGVEGEIGRFRRRHLVPVPAVASLAELNERIGAADAVDDARVITGRTATVGADFHAEQPALSPLPVEAFDPAVIAERRVDHRFGVSVRQCCYSVPARYVGRRLTVRLTATTVQVLDGAKVVAVHVRAVGRYVDVLCLDHYLEVLARKRARSRARPRWPRPRHPARSQRRTNGIGTRSSVTGATGPAPGHWWRYSWPTALFRRTTSLRRWTVPSQRTSSTPTSSSSTPAGRPPNTSPRWCPSQGWTGTTGPPHPYPATTTS